MTEVRPTAPVTGLGEDTVVGTRSSHATDETLVGTRGVATAQSPRSPPRTGELIGRYIVLDIVGSGGMGLVVAAYDPQLDRKVALKLMRPDRARSSDEIEREARIVARLRHPNLVVVHDVGRTDAGVFLAMEFLDGVTLRVLQTRGLSWRELLALYVQAGRGLAAAHDADVVHGDFKPDNVFVASDGREVKLLDFGIARHGAVARDGGEAESSPTGTIPYLAPERWRGDPPSRLSDQFAFCVALFEALNGRRPYDLETLAGQGGSRGEARSLEWSRAVPRWLRRAVARGLSLDPRGRAPSMRELVAELHEGPGRARTRLALGTLAFVVAAGVGAGVVLGDRCRDADAPARAAWSPERARQVGLALDEVLGGGTYDALAPRFERSAADLAAALHRACAPGNDARVERRRQRCIVERIAEIDAIAGLATGTPNERRAAASWVGMGRMSPTACGDDAGLAGRPEASVEQVASPDFRDLLRRIVRASVLTLTDVDAGLAEAEALVPEARVRDAAVHARALVQIATVAGDRGDLTRAQSLLRGALTEAERADDRFTQALVWTYLAYFLGQLEGTVEIEQLAIDRARALAEPLDSLELDALFARHDARVLSRRGDSAGAADRLGSTAREAVAEARPGLAALLMTAEVTHLLRASRPAEALAVAREADDLAATGWLADRDRATVDAALAVAFAANGQLGEADAAAERVLASSGKSDAATQPMVSGVLCNVCHGAGLACDAERVARTCARCVERARAIAAPTTGARIGSSLGLQWQAAFGSPGVLELARQTAGALDGREGWDESRASVAYAMLAGDPQRALEIADRVCEGAGMRACPPPAAYVIARLDGDPRRREAARARVSDAYARGELGGALSPSVALHLVEAGELPRSELAAIAGNPANRCRADFTEIVARAGEPDLGPG